MSSCYRNRPVTGVEPSRCSCHVLWWRRSHVQLKTVFEFSAADMNLWCWQVGGAINDAFAERGRKKLHGNLDGYNKAILTIVHGKPDDTLSILDTSPTPSLAAPSALCDGPRPPVAAFKVRVDMHAVTKSCLLYCCRVELAPALTTRPVSPALTPTGVMNTRLSTRTCYCYYADCCQGDVAMLLSLHKWN